MPHEAELADALDLDGQLQVEYQPIVDAATGAPRGVEALLRWDRPGHGPAPPMEFVPVAEDSGRITDVDLWVLETALEQLERWSTMDALDSLGISVNVSGRSLVDPDFVTDRALVAQQLATLRGLGIRIAIDDFGTGFASVAQPGDASHEHADQTRLLADIGCEALQGSTSPDPCRQRTSRDGSRRAHVPGRAQRHIRPTATADR